MNPIQDWSVATADSLQKLWQGFVSFIPNLIGALIVFIIGWLIAGWVGKLIAVILRKVGLDRALSKTKWDEAMDKADFKTSMSDFIGALVKWVLVIAFLLAAVEILGMGEFAGFLHSIVSWLPNLIVAAAIFVVAIIAAEFIEKLVKAAVGKMNVRYVNMAGTIVRWAVWVFAALAILSQLGVGVTIIQTIVTGIVALVVIAGALAFGLGGKDMAKEWLESIKNKIGQ